MKIIKNNKTHNKKAKNNWYYTLSVNKKNGWDLIEESNESHFSPAKQNNDESCDIIPSPLLSPNRHCRDS